MATETYSREVKMSYKEVGDRKHLVYVDRENEQQNEFPFISMSLNFILYFILYFVYLIFITYLVKLNVNSVLNKNSLI